MNPAAELPVFAEFRDAADDARYRALPGDWALALCDVVASGQAIAAGRYKAVNMAAAAVITAVLNAAADRDLPFTFGGDGAAVAVPPEHLAAAAQALAAAARWIGAELGLTMRVALVPVDAIRAAGHDLRAARLRASPDMTFAMFAGGGSAWAEAEMKAGRFGVPPAPPDARPDLTGLSCRWNPVAARRGVIASLIVLPGAGGATPAFRSLVAGIAALGTAAAHPLPPEGPRPALDFRGVGPEVRAAPPGGRWKVRLGVIVQIVLAWALHRTGGTLGGFDARAYGRELAANSDFRKFDDGLKMTLDLPEPEIAALETRLAEAAARGICRWGLHRQEAALITCLVPSVHRDHLHFVDGAGGGYAAAARRLKDAFPEAA